MKNILCYLIWINKFKTPELKAHRILAKFDHRTWCTKKDFNGNVHPCDFHNTAYCIRPNPTFLTNINQTIVLIYKLTHLVDCVSFVGIVGLSIDCLLFPWKCVVHKFPPSEQRTTLWAVSRIIHLLKEYVIKQIKTECLSSFLFAYRTQILVL